MLVLHYLGFSHWFVACLGLRGQLAGVQEEEERGKSHDVVDELDDGEIRYWVSRGCGS